MKKQISSILPILESYIMAALWSSLDERNMQPLDELYWADDLPQSTIDIMADELGRFMAEASQYLQPHQYRNAATDFWLTRNGHGAGFWDGDWLEHGDKLDAIARKFRECYLYAERGWIYQA